MYSSHLSPTCSVFLFDRVALPNPSTLLPAPLPNPSDLVLSPQIPEFPLVRGQPVSEPTDAPTDGGPGLLQKSHVLQHQLFLIQIPNHNKAKEPGA